MTRKEATALAEHLKAAGWQGVRFRHPVAKRYSGQPIKHDDYYVSGIDPYNQYRVLLAPLTLRKD